MDSITSNHDDQSVKTYIGHCQNDYPSWLLDAVSDTDIDIEGYTPLPDASLYDHRYSDEWQQKTARDARRKGAISLNNLVYIMAREEAYSDILPQLWGMFGFNEPTNKQICILESTDDGKQWQRKDEIKVDGNHDRAFIWYWLLLRWTIEPNESYFFEGWKSDLRISLFQDVNDKNAADNKFIDYFLKLTDIEAYFMNIEKTEKLSLSLPQQLRPTDSEVANQEQSQSELVIRNRPPTSIPNAAAEVGSPSVNKNFLHREGVWWRIQHEYKNRPVQNLFGIRYIALLLESQRKTSVSCTELYQIASGRTPEKIMSESAAIGEGLYADHKKQAVSGYEVKQRYRKQWQKLQDDIDNAEDSPEGEMVKKESKKEQAEIMPYLQERSFPDPDQKKAQINVIKRLDKAYEAIGKAGMKDLEEHLRTHIEPNGAYGLFYTGSLSWDIIW